MKFDATQDAALAESILKSSAILATGAWAFWRYVYQGEFKKRIAFEVDVNFVAIHGDTWLVELIASLDNKGLVSHNITEFTFDLRAIFNDDAITDAGEKANWQLNLPHRLKKGSWLPSTWGNTFVRPGICNRYVYVTTVPESAVAVLLTGRFNYSNKDAFHTATKFIAVPSARAEGVP